MRVRRAALWLPPRRGFFWCCCGLTCNTSGWPINIYLTTTPAADVSPIDLGKVNSSTWATGAGPIRYTGISSSDNSCAPHTQTFVTYQLTCISGVLALTYQFGLVQCPTIFSPFVRALLPSPTPSLNPTVTSTITSFNNATVTGSGTWDNSDGRQPIAAGSAFSFSP